MTHLLELVERVGGCEQVVHVNTFVQLQMRCTISSVKNSLKHSIGDLMFSKLILLAVSEDEASPSPRAAALAAWRRRAASAGESSSGVASAGVASVASHRAQVRLSAG